MLPAITRDNVGTLTPLDLKSAIAFFEDRVENGI